MLGEEPACNLGHLVLVRSYPAWSANLAPLAAMFSWRAMLSNTKTLGTLELRAGGIRFLILSLLGLPAAVHGQGIPEVPRKIIEFDAVSRAFKAPLPFDEPFLISTPLPKGSTGFSAKWGRIKEGECTAGEQRSLLRSTPDTTLVERADDHCGEWILADSAQFTAALLELHDQPTVLIPIARVLKAGEPYRFDFRYEVGTAPLTEKHIFEEKLFAHRETEDSLVSKGVTVTRDTSIVRRAAGAKQDTIWTVAKPLVSPSHRVDLAFGALWAPRAEYGGTLLSGHWYFLHPLNKEADFGQLDAVEEFARGVSLFAGLAVFDLWRPEPEKIQPLTAAGSPVAGVALRLTWLRVPLRITAGGIMFKQEDPHPLVAETAEKIDTFVGLSADFSLKEVLGPLVALVGIK